MSGAALVRAWAKPESYRGALRAVLYDRLASTRQNDPDRGAAWMKAAQAEAERLGLTVVGSIGVYGRSGNQPQAVEAFAPVLRLARHAAFEVLILRDLERIARQSAVLQLCLEELAAHHVEVLVWTCRGGTR